MDHPAETKTVSQRKDPRTTVIELLRSRNKQARFMTELQASLARYGIGTEEADRALAELESERVVMIRDNFCADPHLAGVNLRVVALVESVDGGDPPMSAIRPARRSGYALAPPHGTYVGLRGADQCVGLRVGKGRPDQHGMVHSAHM